MVELRKVVLILIFLSSIQITLSGGYDGSKTVCEVAGYTWINTTTYTNETFNYANNSLISNSEYWSMSAATTILNATINQDSGDTVFDLWDNDAASIQYTNYTLPVPLTGSGVIEVKLRVTDPGTVNRAYIDFKENSTGNLPFYITFWGDQGSPDEWVIGHTDAVSSSYGYYDIDVYHIWKFVIDMAADTISVFLDGANVVNNAAFRVASASLDYLIFYTRSDGANFHTYVDYVNTTWTGLPTGMTGSNYQCCGDDNSNDIFYNGTVSTTTNFCYNGMHITNSTDTNQTICEYYTYTWLPSTNISFAARATYATGTNPQGVAVGDFNKDGYKDIVSVDYNSDKISVFINDGDGTFATKVQYTTGWDPLGVAVGDFNNDDYDDVVTANSNFGSNTISVFINDGDGTFAAETPYTTGSSPRNVAVGDFNNDGYNDIVSADWGNSSVSVFSNDGDGTFATKVSYATGTNPQGVAVGDFNNDGYNDIVSADNGNTRITVLINDGDGTFAAGVAYTTGIGPNNVAVGDFNNDGYNDIVTADYSFSAISVFINDGDGTFAARAAYSTGSATMGVAVDYLNNDVYKDIVTADVGSNLISVFSNDGDGTFAQRINYTTSSSPRDIAVGDFNNDGYNDIVTADYSGNVVGVFINNLYSTSANCCGDDTTNDNFYNGTISTTINFCYNGYPTLQEIDANQTICEYYDYEWFTGSIAGNTTTQNCCGDDLTLDNFYNGTIGINTTSFCYQGFPTFQEIDSNSTLCQHYNYTWLSGDIAGNSTVQACCGDDGTSDDFRNNTVSCVDGTFITDSDISKIKCEAEGYEWFAGPNYTESFSRLPASDISSLSDSWLTANSEDCYTNVSIISGERVLDFYDDWTAGRQARANYTFIEPLSSTNTSVTVSAKMGYDAGYSTLDFVIYDQNGNQAVRVTVDAGVWYSPFEGSYRVFYSGGNSLGGVNAIDAYNNYTFLINVPSKVFNFYINGTLIVQNKSFISPSASGNLTKMEMYTNATFNNLFGNHHYLKSIKVTQGSDVPNCCGAELYGSFPFCCGDDGTSDNFYNGTLGTSEGFCYMGYPTYQEIDVNETLCSYYSYTWASDQAMCCGDDNLEYYNNYTSFDSSLDNTTEITNANRCCTTSSDCVFGISGETDCYSSEAYGTDVDADSETEYCNNSRWYDSRLLFTNYTMWEEHSPNEVYTLTSSSVSDYYYNLTTGDISLNITAGDLRGKSYIKSIERTIYDQTGKLIYGTSVPACSTSDFSETFNTYTPGDELNASSSSWVTSNSGGSKTKIATETGKTVLNLSDDGNTAQLARANYTFPIPIVGGSASVLINAKMVYVGSYDTLTFEFYDEHDNQAIKVIIDAGSWYVPYQGMWTVYYSGGNTAGGVTPTSYTNYTFAINAPGKTYSFYINGVLKAQDKAFVSSSAVGNITKFMVYTSSVDNSGVNQHSYIDYIEVTGAGTSSAISTTDRSSWEKTNLSVFPISLFGYYNIYYVNTTVCDTLGNSYSKQIALHFDKDVAFSVNHLSDLMIGQNNVISSVILPYETGLNFSSSYVQLKIIGTASSCSSESLYCGSTKTPDNNGEAIFDCTINTPGTYKLCMIANTSAGSEFVYSKNINIYTTPINLIVNDKTFALGVSGKKAYEFKITNPTPVAQQYRFWIESTGLFSRFSLNAEQTVSITVAPNKIYYGQIDFFPSIVGSYTSYLKWRNINYPLDNNTAGLMYTSQVVSVMGNNMFEYVVAPDLDIFSLIVLAIVALVILFKKVF